MQSTELLNVILDIGEFFLKSKAEVYRVEDSIERMLFAYGAERVDVFAIPSLITATIKMPNEEPQTYNRRVRTSSVNLHAVSELNALCRNICATTPDCKEIEKQLLHITSEKTYSPFLMMVAYTVSASSFTLFFGGAWSDGLASALSGFLLFFVVTLMNKADVVPAFFHLIGAATAAGTAMLFVHMGIGIHVENIIIGNLMPLVPGLIFTNGMRDLFVGDFMAGIFNLGQAIFFASILAIGGAFVLSLGGV